MNQTTTTTQLTKIRQFSFEPHRYISLKLFAYIWILNEDGSRAAILREPATLRDFANFENTPKDSWRIDCPSDFDIFMQRQLKYEAEAYLSFFTGKEKEHVYVFNSWGDGNDGWRDQNNTEPYPYGVNWVKNI